MQYKQGEKGERGRKSITFGLWLACILLSCLKTNNFTHLKYSTVKEDAFMCERAEVELAMTRLNAIKYIFIQ